jgi:hypothetical protein
VFRQVHDRDVGAFAREQHRHRAADAGIAAGHDRRHVLELAAADVVRREEAWCEIEFVFVAGLVEVLLRELGGLLALAGLHRFLLVGRRFGGGFRVGLLLACHADAPGEGRSRS